MKSAWNAIMGIVLSGFVSVAGVELLLKSFSPRYFSTTGAQYQYDETLGIVTRPNFQRTLTTDHAMEIFTNDIGSRNYQSKKGILQYEKMIFCVGDSYTEGTGNLTDQSYPFYLDLMLNRSGRRYGKEFAVVNLGLGAYGSIQAFESVQRYSELLGRLPDCIIYLISPNDISDDAKFQSGYRHRHAVRGSPYYPPLVIALNERLEFSQIFFRFKTVIHSLFRSARSAESKPPSRDPHQLPGPARLSRQSRPDPAGPGDLPGLRDLIDFSEHHSTKLVISYADSQSPVYHEIREFAGEKNILFADYKPDLEQMGAVFSGLPLKNRHSGGHFRSWVHYVIAENFSAAVRKAYG